MVQVPRLIAGRVRDKLEHMPCIKADFQVERSFPQSD